MPIASTMPKSEMLFKENPNAAIAANVPISETGTAMSGMSVARQDCRKSRTTRITSAIASKSVCTTEVTDS